MVQAPDEKPETIGFKFDKMVVNPGVSFKEYQAMPNMARSSIPMTSQLPTRISINGGHFRPAVYDTSDRRKSNEPRENSVHRN